VQQPPPSSAQPVVVRRTCARRPCVRHEAAFRRLQQLVDLHFIADIHLADVLRTMDCIGSHGLSDSCPGRLDGSKCFE
jgi:hypothetical protein